MGSSAGEPPSPLCTGGTSAHLPGRPGTLPGQPWAKLAQRPGLSLNSSIGWFQFNLSLWGFLLVGSVFTFAVTKKYTDNTMYLRTHIYIYIKNNVPTHAYIYISSV